MTTNSDTTRREAAQVAKAKAARQVEKLFGRFKVATLTPKFTVYMDGYATPVEAEYVPGLTYTVGTTGKYIHIQGDLPLCLPVKRGAYP